MNTVIKSALTGAIGAAGVTALFNQSWVNSLVWQTSTVLPYGAAGAIAGLAPIVLVAVLAGLIGAIWTRR